jgi:hypothetical protein
MEELFVETIAGDGNFQISPRLVIHLAEKPWTLDINCWEMDGHF